MTWRREDVALGQVFERGGILWKVVATVDQPTVVMAPLDERDGEEREHFVIGSGLFAEFKTVLLQDASDHAGQHLEAMSV